MANITFINKIKMKRQITYSNTKPTKEIYLPLFKCYFFLFLKFNTNQLDFYLQRPPLHRLWLCFLFGSPILQSPVHQEIILTSWLKIFPSTHLISKDLYVKSPSWI